MLGKVWSSVPPSPQPGTWPLAKWIAQREASGTGTISDERFLLILSGFITWVKAWIVQMVSFKVKRNFQFCWKTLPSGLLDEVSVFDWFALDNEELCSCWPYLGSKVESGVWVITRQWKPIPFYNIKPPKACWISSSGWHGIYQAPHEKQENQGKALHYLGTAPWKFLEARWALPAIPGELFHSLLEKLNYSQLVSLSESFSPLVSGNSIRTQQPGRGLNKSGMLSVTDEGLLCHWLHTLHFDMPFLSINEENKPWRTRREKPFVAHLTWDRSLLPPPRQKPE